MLAIGAVVIISLLISSPSSARTSQLGITELTVDNHTQRNFVSGYIVPTIEWRYQTDGYFNCGPCVDDIDNDGKPEVLFGQGGYYGFYCLDNNGSLKWVSNSVPGSVSSVVAADVDGDGRKEIVLGSYDSYVYCLNSTGGLKWSFATGSPITPALVIAKIGEGAGQKIFAESDNYTLYCLDGTGGLLWKFNAGGSLSPPVVADLNEDGKSEIVLLSRAYSPSWIPVTTIYCLNETGSVNWSRSQGPNYNYYCYSFPPVVFNGDGSGKPVIVVGSSDGNIYCLNGNGSVKSVCQSPSGEIAAVGNIDADTQQEVVIPSGGSTVWFLDGIEGVKYLFRVDSYFYSFPPGIADMDGNLRNEVVVASADNNLYCGDTVYGLEWKFDLGGYLSGPPSFADLNSDGRQEIVVAVGSNFVYCIGTALPPLTGGSLGGDGNPSSTFDFNFLLVTGGAVFLIAIMGVVSTIRRRQVRASMRDHPIGRDLRQETESVDREAAPISTPRYCYNCGAEVSHPDSLYCFNCGVRLGTFLGSTVRPIEGAKIEPRVGGKCMVCGSNVESGEPILYCPRCGNAGHRAHLLQWIHLRNYCPMCGSHLNEGDLKDEHTRSRPIIRHP